MVSERQPSLSPELASVRAVLSTLGSPAGQQESPASTDGETMTTGSVPPTPREETAIGKSFFSSLHTRQFWLYFAPILAIRFVEDVEVYYFLTHYTGRFFRGFCCCASDFTWFLNTESYLLIWSS